MNFNNIDPEKYSLVLPRPSFWKWYAKNGNCSSPTDYVEGQGHIKSPTLPRNASSDTRKGLLEVKLR